MPILNCLISFLLEVQIYFVLKFLARFGLSSSIPYVVILFIEEENIKFHIIFSLEREFQAVFYLQDKNTHCKNTKLLMSACFRKQIYFGQVCRVTPILTKENTLTLQLLSFFFFFRCLETIGNFPHLSGTTFSFLPLAPKPSAPSPCPLPQAK